MPENTNIPAENPKKGFPAPSKKVLIITAICLAIVAVLLSVTIYLVYFYNGIYPGVTVNGQRYSGQSRSNAVALLQEQLSQTPIPQTVTVHVGNESFSLDTAAISARYDSKKTAEAAYLYGRAGNIFDRLNLIFSSLFSGSDIPAALSMDDKALENEISHVTMKIASQLAQPSFTFEDDKLLLDRGQTGIYIDQKELRAFIKDRLLRGDFAEMEYEPRIAEPDALDLLMIKNQVEQAPQNPSLDLVADPKGGIIVPAKRGVQMDIDAAKAALDATDERIVELPVTFIEPNMSTEQFKAALFRDVLGHGQSGFNAGIAGRTTNVRLAAEHCNDLILNPGDEFSYNNTVGPRTYARGFKDAIVYVGASAEDGVGGGICQVSSTIYYAALRADLKISERASHSRMVVYVPLGEDATVAWGFRDFKFINNTDYPIKLRSYIKKSTLYIDLLGTATQNKTVEMKTTVHSKSPFETQTIVNPLLPVGTSKVKSNGYTGYTTETWRVVYIDGKEVSRTFENKSTYKKYDKIIEENPKPVIAPIVPPVVPPVEPTAPPVEPLVPPVEPVVPPVEPIDPDIVDVPPVE